MQKFSTGDCAALKEYPPDHSREPQKPRGPQPGDPEAQEARSDLEPPEARANPETQKPKAQTQKLKAQKPRTLD